MPATTRLSACLGLLVGACQPAPEDDCARGSLACLCQPDGGCDFGLQCEGTICVSPGVGESSGDASSGDGSSDPTSAPGSDSSGNASDDPSGEPDSDSSTTADDDPTTTPPSICGDGTCDPDADETWSACWSDCSDDAPLQPLSEIYGECVGATNIFDGAPSSDWLWVRSDTHALMYVEGDQVIEISGVTLDGATILLDGEFFGYVGCHRVGANACAPVILQLVESFCYPSAAVVDFAIEGNALSFAEGDGFSACDALCGNGVCDAGESYSACSSLEHGCPEDCPQEAACEMCTD